MTTIWLLVLNTLKGIILKVLSEKFFVWLFFWTAKMLVESTKTNKDDEFYEQIKKVYYSEK